MKTFARGQRAKLDSLTAATDLTIGVRLDAPGHMTFDVCCFGVDENSQLADERYLIFFNQPRAPQGEIQMRGPQAGEHETFEVHLGPLPPSVRRLVFTATIDGIGTMTQLRSGHLRVCEAASGAEVVRYEFHGADFHTEQALLSIAELYWKDGWRFGAIGQGFAGDLRRLLKHFGGVEAEESRPPEAAPTPPSAPPDVRSNPANAAANAMPQSGRLADLIAATAPGGVLVLQSGEYEGPVTLDRPLTLDGRQSVIWARQGPVLSVSAPGVTLRDVQIEVTAPRAGGNADVALQALSPVQLENVAVRGRVTGVAAAGEEWKLPEMLDLGQFAPRQINRWSFDVAVPVACRVSSPVSGLQVQPEQLSPGVHRVALEARDVPRETLLAGKIEVHAAGLVRAIAVHGQSARDESTVPINGIVLWTLAN